MDKYQKAIKLMNHRFKKDTLLSIVTVENGRPFVRVVDAYFEEEDNSFYTVTYSLSNKVKQIEANPEVAVCTIEWFNGHGIGENCGWVRDPKNAQIMEKLRAAFAKWYTGGHVNEDDPNTCLLRIKLTQGLLIDHAKKYGFGEYEIDFTNKTVKLLVAPHNSATVDIDNRTGVIEVIKPQEWFVVRHELSAYKGKNITLKFSADVKRVGAAGEIKWEINNASDGYPAICRIENAAPDIWHTCSGEWTGIPSDDYPMFLLSTYGNNSENTTYYISNFTIEIVPKRGGCKK